MIAFACKKCGKKDRRPESQAGTLVFCTCGTSNRVPWASESPPDVPEAVPTIEHVPSPRPAPQPRRVPILDAVPVPVPEPSPRAAPRPVPAATPAARPSVLDAPLGWRNRPGKLLGKVNAKFCFHHDELPSETTCSACKLPFCASCVIELQGEVLCGPCKNFRLAAKGRPERVPPLAVVALVTALSGGPVALILSLVGVGLFRAEGMIVAAVTLCLVGSALPAGSLVLARMALRRIEARPDAGGQSFAISGACIALVELLWCGGIIVLLVVQNAF